MVEAKEIVPHEETRNAIERLFPSDVLPTRKFVIELPGFQKKVPEPGSVGRGYQMKWPSYPNWIGITEIGGREVKSEIETYSAITRFTFKTDESCEEWLMNEDGGEGFTLQLYGNGMNTEAIVNAFFDGADFYAHVLYKERKRVSYAWRWPEPDHIFPTVTLRDIEAASGNGLNVQRALEILEKFKQVLLSSTPDQNFARLYHK